MQTKSKNPRRNFIKNTSLVGAGTLGAPLLGNAAINFQANAELADRIPKGTTILFQGDSITDAGRNKSNYYANDSWGMGLGYVMLTVAELLGRFPALKLRCYNRGISGNKVFQLADRWEEDCLQLKPDVLSILIGVNDFWHTLTHNYKGTADTYANDLRRLLDRTLKELPNLKLIICDPFYLKEGTAINVSDWSPAFDAYRKNCAMIAKEYKAVFIPFQQIFDEALKDGDTKYWAADGVHPSIAGSQLMKQAWMKGFKSLYQK